MRWRVRIASLVVITTLFASVLAGGTPAQGAGRYRVRAVRLAPGVVWKRIVDSVGPNRLNALIFTPSAGSATLDATLAGVFPTVARTSAMASRRHALAAVNGDFGTFEGRPTHVYQENGDLIDSGFQTGSAFAMAADGSRAYFGSPQVSMTATAASGSLTVDKWNAGEPTADQVASFTPQAGSLISPPQNACAARLSPTSNSAWTAGRQAIVESFSVDAVHCQSSALARNGDVVLATKLNSANAGWFRSLAPGDPVSVTRSVGWPDVTDVMGGSLMILKNGQMLGPSTCDSYICDRNPRTAVGATSGCITPGTGVCRIILLTVDGRQPGYSLGMTFPQLESAFLRLGATWAMNLDGGGSTTMWIRGRGVVNRPTDPSGERSVVNALVVLPGTDPSETLP